jgi:hypothetical protein
MAKVVQRQHDDPFLRLPWDPDITGLDIALPDRDEWIVAGGNHSDFPLSFSFKETISIYSLRSCSSSLWWQDVQLEEAMFGLEWSWKSGSFYMEVECYF